MHHRLKNAIHKAGGPKVVETAQSWPAKSTGTQATLPPGLPSATGEGRGHRDAPANGPRPVVRHGTYQHSAGASTQARARVSAPSSAADHDAARSPGLCVGKGFWVASTGGVHAAPAPRVKSATAFLLRVRLVGSSPLGKRRTLERDDVVVQPSAFVADDTVKVGVVNVVPAHVAKERAVSQVERCSSIATVSAQRAQTVR